MGQNFCLLWQNLQESGRCSWCVHCSDTKLLSDLMVKGESLVDAKLHLLDSCLFGWKGCPCWSQILLLSFLGWWQCQIRWQAHLTPGAWGRPPCNGIDCLFHWRNTLSFSLVSLGKLVWGLKSCPLCTPGCPLRASGIICLQVSQVCDIRTGGWNLHLWCDNTRYGIVR